MTSNNHASARLTSALVCLAVLLAAGCAVAAPQSAGRLLWIEGESATRSQTYRNAWFDAVDPDELSGGAQLGSFSEVKDPAGWADYDFAIAQAGTYHLWLRANAGTGLLFRLDDGAWQKLDPDALDAADRANGGTPGYVRRRQQQFNVAADGSFDARDMTWFQPADLRLTEGRHTLHVNLGGDAAATKRFAALDCFVLTTEAFSPNYQYKPGVQPTGILTAAPGATWAFSPLRDALSPAALLDLRYLNEHTAGEHGFIRLSRDGSGFVRGDGAPIRFWGGCDYVQRLAHDQKSQAVLEHHAQFLAKRGVNIVRLHGAIEPKGADSRIEDVDDVELDEMYRLVAAMKTAGIYTMIDPYWAVAAHAQPRWGVPDAQDGNLTALLFFDKTLQRGYKAWLKRIYADVNPYTGIPLAKDPSIAAIQLQNEDSMLFWTIQSVKGPALLELRRLYGDFLVKKYGSLAAAAQAWQGAKAADDDMEHGLPAILIVWELTQDARNKIPGSPGRDARLADETEFFARTMRDFNAEMVRYLRDDLGCKQLILPGNWRTADQVILDDAERWSYLAGDIEGKNHYFAGIHNGINNGWQILPGHVYTSRSWTKDPIGSPLGIRQAVGRPFMIPETLWVPPNRCEAEGPIIAACQTALTGLGPLFWFADGAEEWDQPIPKWSYAIPMTLGQFPAAALAYRLGYVETSAPVVHEERTDADVFGRKQPMIAEEGAWDPNRDTVRLPTGAEYRSPVDPLAFLVGRVEVKYEGDPAKSRAIDLAPYIDKSTGTIRSVTGQITSNTEQGLYRVNAPRLQAVAGFLGAAGPQHLADVWIAARNEFGCVAVASLDQKPLASSRKILVQVGTQCHPTGWKERAMQVPIGKTTVDGMRILDTGKAPWQIQKAQITVRLRNSLVRTAHILDANGMPVGTVPATRDGAWLRFSFPEDALYVVLE